MDAKVWDSSALEAIDQMVVKFQEEGKRVHLRHLSADCRALLAKAGDLVEVNVLEDPAYAVAADNEEPEKVEVVTPVLKVGSSNPAAASAASGVDLDPRLFASLEMQYGNNKDSGEYVVYNFE